MYCTKHSEESQGSRCVGALVVGSSPDVSEVWALVEPLTVCVTFIALYCYVLAGLSSRNKGKLQLAPNQALYFVFLIPALNEEAVIGRTLRSLLGLRGDFLILVIDDASDDGTVDAITPFLKDKRVQLLRQPHDRARRGKGAALNSGYDAVLRSGLAEKYGAANVIVTVFDSDAHVEPDFLQILSPYFLDQKLAGVQSGVRMYNARQGLLALWQHLEFAIWGSMFCCGKNVLGTATLGGNGQCVRLSALESLGSSPWQPWSLTEDLELSLRLLLRGWRMKFCVLTAVDQEAVVRLRPLIRQRSRWMQGHFACWHHLPALMRARLPWYSRLDLAIYLLLPTAFLPVGLISVASWVVFAFRLDELTPTSVLSWYLLGFGIAPLAAVAIRRLEGMTAVQSIWHAHLFTFYSIVWFLAAAVAVKNVIAGHRAWAKTSRIVPTRHYLPDQEGRASVAD